MYLSGRIRADICACPLSTATIEISLDIKLDSTGQSASFDIYSNCFVNADVTLEGEAVAIRIVSGIDLARKAQAHGSTIDS